VARRRADDEDVLDDEDQGEEPEDDGDRPRRRRPSQRCPGAPGAGQREPVTVIWL